MDDLERIITVMEEQIALCGTDSEHDRITVYMTADDSKRIVKWLKTIVESRPQIVRCCDCVHQNYCSIHDAKYLDDWFCADGEVEE